MPVLSGLAFLFSGVFQFSEWKKRGLGHCTCTAPIHSGDVGNPSHHGWEFGFREGKNCVACCLGLMVIMLVLGAMELWVMLVIALSIGGEKLIKNPSHFAQITGWISVLVGVALIVKSII